MKIGIFDSLITFKPLAKTATGTGGYSEVYSANNVTRWGRVESVSQNREYSGSLNMTNVKAFWVRYDSEVEAVMDKTTLLTYNSLIWTISKIDIITDGSDFYKITAVNNG